MPKNPCLPQVEITELSLKFGYTFTKPALLLQALQHRSLQLGIHNERLEFLGDAVLNMIIAADLFKRYPTATEGTLSQLRSLLVCEKTLMQLAQELELGRYLQLGKGELKTGINRPALLADALEALIGAVYLDGGLSSCERCVLACYGKQLEQVTETNYAAKDPKSQLQEVLQAQKRPLPRYRIISQTGPSHQPIFQIACELTDVSSTQIGFDHPTAIGTGTSRQRAEQNAAANQLLQLQAQDKNT